MASTLWQPGEVVLDLYEVLDDVRSGGMGTVQRVRHLGWSVDLAVKTPRPEQVASTSGRRRFEAEAGTWVGLGLHPHTVNCAYVRTVGGVPRVFAEWIDGGDLAQAVTGGRLYEGGTRAALARVLDVAVQTAWGLQHAHDTGLVHQDVKPANVMLETDGTAKVTDFGLAGARAPDADGTTASGVTFGGMTRPYCSPEQARAAAGHREIRLTSATDVWSWALTVLEMFTGHRPTNYGQAAAEALDALTANGPEDPRVPPLPPAVAGLLRQCFMTADTARPSRLDEVAGILSEVYGDVLGTPYPRPVPKAAALLADGLSNQALSLLDLGRTEEAEQRWRTAMAADPHSLTATFNFGLHQWRKARKTDAELLAELTSAREIGGDDALGARLIGLVHLERDDREHAAELLGPAAPGEPVPAETAEALAELTRDPGTRPVVLTGHEGTSVSAVAVTADGGLVLSGDYQGVLRLWETSSGRCLRELTSEGSHVVAVAVDGEGRIGLVGREEGLPEAWDLLRGERLPLPTGQVAEGVTSVALSADGSVGTTAHTDGTLWFWHLDTGRLVGPVPSRTEHMTALELGDGGAIAVTAGGLGETTIRLWDVGAGVCRAALTEPRSDPLRSAWGGFVRRAAVAPGVRYAVQMWDGPMVLWNVATRQIATQVPHDVTDVSTLALTPDGSLAVVGSGQPLRVMQTATGRCLRTFGDGMSRHTSHLAMSGDGSRAVLTMLDGRIKVQPLPVPRYRAPWAYARPRAAGELTDHAGRFRAAMREGERLFEAGHYAQSAACLRTARAVPGHARNPDLLNAWSMLGQHGRRTGLRGAWQKFDFTGRLGSPSAMAFIGDGSVFLAGLFPDRFLLCDAADARNNRMIPSLVTASAAPLMTSDGTAAVVPGRSETALLDLRDDRTVLLDREDIRAVALSDDRAWLLTGEESGTLCLWDVEDVRRQPQYADPSSGFRGHQGPVGAVAISPDRRYGASNAFNGAEEDRRRRYDLDELCGWDLAAGLRLWRHTGRPAGAHLRFAPDGRSVLEWGQFGVHAYDAASGRRIYSVEGPYNIATLQISADGRRAVIAGYGTLVVLDPATGRVLREIPDPGLINTVVVTVDGRFALSGLADEDVHLWDLDQGQRLRVIEGHRGQVFGMALSADARQLLVTELDYTRCLELDWEYEW